MARALPPPELLHRRKEAIDRRLRRWREVTTAAQPKSRRIKGASNGQLPRRRRRQGRGSCKEVSAKLVKFDVERGVVLERGGAVGISKRLI